MCSLVLSCHSLSAQVVDIDDDLIASQKQHLLTIAHYALAWLANLIEKEEA